MSIPFELGNQNCGTVRVELWEDRITDPSAYIKAEINTEESIINLVVDDAGNVDIGV